MFYAYLKMITFYRSFFQLVGDLDELKRKDYPEVKKLTLGDKKVSKGMIVIFTNAIYSDQGIICLFVIQSCLNLDISFITRI